MKTIRSQNLGSWAMVLMLVVGAATLTAFGPAESEEEDEQKALGFMAAKGRVTYRTYCASCHGREARGDGNLAQYLTVAPSDLTRISERRGGEFPRDEIAATIDGRSGGTKGHGSREMPVWGDVFQSPLSADSGPAEEPEERAQRKVAELVYFLETIQQAAEE